MNLPTELNDLEKYILARWAYSVSQPLITDPEYDVLEQSVKVQYPDSEYCHRSWSSDPCPMDLLKRVGMENLAAKIILGDKTESIPSLNTDYDVQSELSYITGRGTLSMKHDGWNTQFNYYNGELVSVNTRGRFSDAMDVSVLREKVPQRIPEMGSIRIVAECTVSKENFHLCKQLFNNVSCRSAVSSVLSRPEYHYLLDVHAFDIHGKEIERCDKFKILEEWDFTTPMWVYVTNYDSLWTGLHHLSEQSTSYSSPTDGAVYDGIKRRAIRLLAWEEPIYRSYVTGYSERFGPNRISPSVEIYPIYRKGSTQRQLSLTNWARIIDYNLQPGAPIAFRVASDATADFDEESTRLLHKQLNGDWEEYRLRVEENEVMKQWAGKLQ